MRNSEQVVEEGLDLVTQILKVMSAHPDKVRMGVEESAGTFGLTVTAHPSDTRRIVGKGASNLRALDSLTRLLFRGSGVMVKFNPVIALKVKEDEKTPFKPDYGWPKSEIVDLVRGISGAVFRGREVRVECEDQTTWASRITIVVTGDVGPVLGRFEHVLSVLFASIGHVRGRALYIYAGHVKSKLR